MLDENINVNDDEIYIEGICKSIQGSEDENGNYIFEVEASNENLDLQNQKTLQSALENSEEYFKTNGVISDDHLHKTRDENGNVETHKDKIIGEPLEVTYDKKTKRTFVKGILYKAVKAAKPYIDMLKSGSTRVKASIGGIMPKIKTNPDGTETVTSFMWNDLALTCSPVNWTVQGAKFAKSMDIMDFCKSLTAGYGTNAATMTGGTSLQIEDIEDETKNIMDITDGDIKGSGESDDFEKSEDKEESVIREAVISIDNGELKTRSDIESFLMDRGFSQDKASETTLEIIKQGGTKMIKSHFSSTVEELLKSIKSDDKDSKKEKDSEDEETTDDTLFDDEDEEDSEEEVEKCSVKKSYDEDDESVNVDVTEIMKSMADKLDALESENEELRKSMLEITESFADFAKVPNSRSTVVQKSVTESVNNVAAPSKRPSNADFDLLKSCLVKACKDGAIGVADVQLYNSEFQKSMNGMPMANGSWEKICDIVKKYR